ncbi:MAG: homoserine dehydrogenase, partial [Anaerolineales bacterium]|nr:homoserine dehydrogenase [Anaerolineales bacterium]
NNVPAQASGWDAATTIDRSEADVLVEISYTDLKTGEPALSHIRQALEKGMNVVTTNKGPIALNYPELSTLAQQKGAQIGVEGTVMSGTPALHLGMDLLAGAGITRVQGILNGTTNFILTKMESGASYQQALEEAQALGYAEADPTGDVEGFDAAGKIVILGNVLMGEPITMDDVERIGISKLTSQDVEEANAEGCRWKLIGNLEKTPNGITASVKPTLLPITHPLANVGGATNAITYTTDLLGEVTLVGPGAGRMETGYALVCDMLAFK